MKSEIVNKHDAMFKEVFSQKRIAKDFIENNIPREALDIIDMDTLELQKDTFINDELKESFSDLIYRVNINSTESYICFLLEHKSYKDKMAIFQIHKYILESWMQIVQKQNKKDLPIILPMLIYHGKDKWDLKTDLRYMISGFYELPEYFKERVPVFKYDLYNIGKYEADDFERFESLTSMMLKAFKYAFEKDPKVMIRSFLLSVDEVKDEETSETLAYYVQLYLRYIEQINPDITEKDIEAEIINLDGKGAVTMGMLEKREEKGLQKGLELGKQEAAMKIAENLIRDDSEVSLIVKVTGLSQEEVEKLKEKLNN